MFDQALVVFAGESLGGQLHSWPPSRQMDEGGLLRMLGRVRPLVRERNLGSRGQRIGSGLGSMGRTPGSFRMAGRMRRTRTGSDK